MNQNKDTNNTSINIPIPNAASKEQRLPTRRVRMVDQQLYWVTQCSGEHPSFVTELRVPAQDFGNMTCSILVYTRGEAQEAQELSRGYLFS